MMWATEAGGIKVKSNLWFRYLYYQPRPCPPEDTWNHISLPFLGMLGLLTFIVSLWSLLVGFIGSACHICFWFSYVFDPPAPAFNCHLSHMFNQHALPTSSLFVELIKNCRVAGNQDHSNWSWIITSCTESKFFTYSVWFYLTWCYYSYWFWAPNCTLSWS